MLAQHGNIQGMKRLFEQKLASPFDISLEKGRSALHFAVTATQPKMVSFLLNQGADPRLEDHNMLSAHDVVWNYLLQMSGSPEMEILLSAAGLSPTNTDSLEKRDFTTLHRIVLGLSTINLESYLDTTTSNLDVGDSLGKTALCWAASRPDTKMVETLLKYGASPCLGDRRKQTPLHYSAGSGSPHSTALILEAALEEAKQKASEWRDYHIPQEVADRPGFVSNIVDARDSKGRTPLNFATRMNFPEHTRLLISAGADMECVDSVLDRTTLLSATYWKSHNVMSILLESGARTDALDARDASVLHYAARFGDLETLEILSNSNLGQLDIAIKDHSGLTAWEVFESRHERCIIEEEEMRESSISAFGKILEHVTHERASPAHVCNDMETDDSSDPFEEGITKLKALTATLGKAPKQLSKERRSSTF